jgi:hypothetical protein
VCIRVVVSTGLALLSCLVGLVATADATPVVERITPTKGSGRLIVLNGKGLKGATAVHVGSVEASFSVGADEWGEWIDAHAYEALPPGSDAQVTVTTPEGTSSPLTFTYLTPQLTWIENASPIRAGGKVPTIAWGTLTLESAPLTATCKVAEAANIIDRQPESEPTTTTAQAETVLFLPYQCSAVAGGCTSSPRVIASGLPWSQVAEGAEEQWGKVYEGVRLTLECPGESAELFTGGEATSWNNGTSAGRPSEAIMRSSSLSGLTIKGRLKVVGYEGPAPLVSLQPMT